MVRFKSSEMSFVAWRHGYSKKSHKLSSKAIKNVIDTLKLYYYSAYIM